MSDIIPFNNQDDQTKIVILSYIQKRAYYFKDRFIAKYLKLRIYAKRARNRKAKKN